MKRFKKVVTIVIIGILCLSIGLLSACQQASKPYQEAVIQSKVFSNDFETHLPQTVVAQIVRDHFNEPLKEGTKTKKAMILGYDGARADGLVNIKDQIYSGSNKLAETGGIYLSFAGGYAGDEATKQRPETAPGWASILTGVWAKDHKVTENYAAKDAAYPTILTELVEKGQAKSTSFHAAWGGHLETSEHGRGSYIDEKEYAAAKSLKVRFIDYDVKENLPIDMPVLEGVLSELKKEQCDDIIFSIFEHPDSDGHGTGYGNENMNYIRAINLCEQYSYKVIKEIESRKTYNQEDWLIIITADHGGDKKGHSKQNLPTRETFISCNKSLESYIKK